MIRFFLFLFFCFFLWRGGRRRGMDFGIYRGALDAERVGQRDGYMAMSSGTCGKSSLTNNECSRASLSVIQHDVVTIPKRNDGASRRPKQSFSSWVSSPRRGKSNSSAHSRMVVLLACSPSSCNDERTMIVRSSPFLLGHLAMKVSSKKGRGTRGLENSEICSAETLHPLCMHISA